VAVVGNNGIKFVDSLSVEILAGHFETRKDALIKLVSVVCSRDKREERGMEVDDQNEHENVFRETGDRFYTMNRLCESCFTSEITLLKAFVRPSTDSSRGILSSCPRRMLSCERRLMRACHVLVSKITCRQHDDFPCNHQNAGTEPT
jgi:hypothetical protein